MAYELLFWRSCWFILSFSSTMVSLQDKDKFVQMPYLCIFILLNALIFFKHILSSKFPGTLMLENNYKILLM